jgi:hypothetical protein
MHVVGGFSQMWTTITKILQESDVRYNGVMRRCPYLLLLLLLLLGMNLKFGVAEVWTIGCKTVESIRLSTCVWYDECGTAHNHQSVYPNSVSFWQDV